MIGSCQRAYRLLCTLLQRGIEARGLSESDLQVILQHFIFPLCQSLCCNPPHHHHHCHRQKMTVTNVDETDNALDAYIVNY